MSCARGCCDSPAEHYRSIGFGAAAMPTRKAATVAAEAMEHQMSVDHPAYRRMRREGLQPKSSVGAAMMEAKATNRFEIESGQLFGKVRNKDARIAEGMAISKEMGTA